MKLYPFQSPIILNDTLFIQYGGQGASNFTSTTLQNSYLLAEMQVSTYIGSFLLPTTITGTYPFMHQTRIATDWGYVQQLLHVNVLTRQNFSDCSLTSNDGCGYVYSDTFGYVDFRKLTSTCGWTWWWGSPYSPYILDYQPYQIQLSYIAGLPTGIATQPGIMEALTILAQVDLNEKFPGLAGVNESVGAVGIQNYASIDYRESRADHALIKTALGDDARSQRAKKLIDMSVKKARRALFA